MRRTTRRLGTASGLLLGLCLATVPDRGHAQTLDDFVASACRDGLDAHEARLLESQADSRAQASRARLLPSLRATAGYARNSEEARLAVPGMAPGEQTEIVITPRDQLDASVGVAVPLVDIGAWRALSQSELAADAQRERTENAMGALRIDVTRAYHRLVAAEAVHASAERALRVADRDVAFVEARRGAGLATELDVSRARTDRARARQTVLESELEVGLARRSLESISGLRPRAVVPTETEPASGPLSSWLAGTAALPAVRAARLDREAADAVSSSAWSDLLPTLSASADYRATNAAGFGSATSWTAGVSAVWTLDFAKPAAIDQASDERAIAAVRAARAERAAADAITESWLRARALHARLAAARAEEAHAARASELARARHATGRATQLELAQAERDAFAAGVSRIRAEADLAVATTELRVRAARIPGCEGGAR